MLYLPPGSAKPDRAQGASVADEELIIKCIEVARQEQKCSTSPLQRRLRLGYARTARMAFAQRVSFVILVRGGKPDQGKAGQEKVGNSRVDRGCGMWEVAAMPLVNLPSPGSLKAFCRKNGIAGLSLFGPVARADFEQGRSDVDLNTPGMPGRFAEGIAGAAARLYGEA